MLRYALRVLPVSTLLVSCAVAASLLWLVDVRPGAYWPAAGIAAALVGAAAGRLSDEPAAAVVDTLPRALWWRTAARLLPAAVLAVGWVVGVSTIDLQGVGRPGNLRLEGVGIILLAVAATTALRRRGVATPSFAVAAPLVLALSFLALANPLPGALPVFPYGPSGHWPANAVLWLGVAAFSAALLVVSCVERPRLSPRTGGAALRNPAARAGSRPAGSPASRRR